MIKQTYSPLFELFWDAYPLKRGKGYAYKCWLSLEVTEGDMDVILGAVEAQKQAYMRDGGEWRYFKHPSTWLNQACWEDESPPDKSEIARIDSKCCSCNNQWVSTHKGKKYCRTHLTEARGW